MAANPMGNTMVNIQNVSISSKTCQILRLGLRIDIIHIFFHTGPLVLDLCGQMSLATL